MLVFWKERLVILAMPKTGTTALHAALAPRAAMALRNPPFVKHTPYQKFNRLLRPFFDASGLQDLESFAVIRNPVDWLGSWFRYRSRPGLEGHDNSTAGMSFDDFVQAYCREDQPPQAAVGSQARFLQARDGRIGVDHLFRYEAQESLIGFLEDRLSTKLDLPQLNVSPVFDLTITDETEALLRARYAADFAAWDSARS